jgi:radical SAM protein with 4Fe4S-binding SPASM domain
MQVLRLRSNEHEWLWISRNYKKLGATRLVFKTAQLYDYQHGHPLMPSQARYSRYRKAADGSYFLHRSWLRRHWINTPCYRLWSGCVVTTTGEILPCCYDKAGQFSFGSLTKQSIEDVWHSSKAKAFRQGILHHSQDIPICQECNF